MEDSKLLNPRSLEHMPIQLFAIIMGLSGMAIMFAKGYHLLDIPYSIYATILFIDAAIFLLIFTAYRFKGLWYPHAVKIEFTHPIKMSFTAPIAMSFLLLCIAYYAFAP
ncbi:MAG: C4-dicarboxylate ABC transporter, partial [Sulfurimonas sp.]|nr:C4-dicarboxylate ABC transporter [Sulfurimonas sp.]